ncbi:nicotinamide riboside transporter PnuC [Paludibacter sp. 221]|uniref:nicotinamide riboside transporter PnuC n=1 Tax=Paludibacter sp. 221 TaxID=2302939 RepID=UPI0013D8DBF3|nr:nicotinamide riboside transporter PnuC [Paludibacter sp. 221]NDV46825.1 nicotinamide riboside transporter PnuC [Paludibacter sp. 221]
MLTYLQNNWVEVVGSILSLIYLYLSVKQRSSLWIFGFLCSVFYVVIFFDSKFYADMTLQIYYVIVSVYGWIVWKWGKDKSGKNIPISNVPKRTIPYLIIIAAAIFFLYAFVLSNYTDSPLPKADSFTTALSIVATWMLARKYIEYWLVFIVVDAVSAGLYFYKELYPTAILFVFYTIMAIVGYLQWKKTIEKQIS